MHSHLPESFWAPQRGSARGGRAGQALFQLSRDSCLVYPADFTVGYENHTLESNQEITQSSSAERGLVHADEKRSEIFMHKTVLSACVSSRDNIRVL